MTTMARRHSFGKFDAISHRALIALVTLLVVGAGITVAATNRFAVVGIENGTERRIRVQHKWGDDAWETRILQPGQRWLYWWEYRRANQNRSPELTVKFDSDYRPGEVFDISRKLEKYAAPSNDWAHARKYIFKYDGNRNFVDLVPMQ